MYWRGPRDRSVGGKMLKILSILTLFISLNAFPCWKVEGSFAVDGETWKIDQKFDHGKIYSLPMGPFIVNLSIKSEKNKTQTLTYNVQEKKGTTLTLVTKGEEEGIIESKSREIFAKGEEGQPNSIIIVKLKNI